MSINKAFLSEQWASTHWFAKFTGKLSIFCLVQMFILHRARIIYEQSDRASMDLVWVDTFLNGIMVLSPLIFIAFSKTYKEYILKSLTTILLMNFIFLVSPKVFFCDSLCGLQDILYPVLSIGPFLLGLFIVFLRCKMSHFSKTENENRMAKNK